MSFQLGQRAGDYEFIDIIDSTPSRIAYKVRHIPLNRFEMLEVQGAADRNDDEKTRRFLREASVHGRLLHPGIVRFYNATTLEGHFVITTELAEGVRLAERLELGPLPQAEAIEIFRQFLSALSCAHDHGVVHRNLSTRSLVLTTDAGVKLTGFTFARAGGDPAVTRIGIPLGDPYYMSPERIRHGGDLDPRSDIYSAGAIFYEAITGSKPFEAKRQFDVLTAHLERLPAPPSSVNPRLSPEWDEVTLKAMAKSPKDRFQSASEFLEAIEKLPLGAPDQQTAGAAGVFEAATPDGVPDKAGFRLPLAEAGRLAWTRSLSFAELVVVGVLLVLLAAVAVSAGHS